MKYTKEDLMNTWGVVESKEHAEFIIELASSHGYDCEEFAYDGRGYFYTNESCLSFTSSFEVAGNDGEKQITIPLPPKTKEWSPKVGDKVVISRKHNRLEGELLALTKEYAIISQPYGEQPFYLSNWSFEKPKTKQDLLIEELHQKLLANNCSDEYLLACDIVQGKIEGLSYE